MELPDFVKSFALPFLEKGHGAGVGEIVSGSTDPQPHSRLRDYLSLLFRSLKTEFRGRKPREFILPGVGFLILVLAGYAIVTSLLR